VAQRPELTRITDTDRDGKADFFEVLTDEFGMSGNYHEFNFCAEPDKDGNIFFALGTGSSGNGIRRIVRGRFDERGRPGRMHASTPYRGWVMKYTPDGRTIPFAGGLRTPNGVGFDLAGRLYVTDNQGDWLGTSKLFHVEEGRFYGHAASLTWREGFTETPLEVGAERLHQIRTRAAVLFPQGLMANSPTKPLCDTTEGKFGPFAGQLFVGEMNKSRIMRVLLEEVDGQMQGACLPFIDGSRLSSGNNRMAFDRDGNLWVGHTRHSWAGSHGIQKIVWDGKMPMDILTMNLTEKGFRLTFTKPVGEAAAHPEAYTFQRYWYQYHQSYGSRQYDVVPVGVNAAKLSADGLTVDLDLDELKAWHVHELKLNGIVGRDGSTLANSLIVYTVNRLLANTPPEPKQWSGSAKKARSSRKNTSRRTEKIRKDAT
ncbi:MAG: hypothetical protein AAF492_26215, partial [Verrucomicrobiota bacterium]